MKRELKGTVNMKLQAGEKVKLNNVLYTYQDVNNLLSVSRLMAKGSTMGDTKDRNTIKKRV